MSDRTDASIIEVLRDIRRILMYPPLRVWRYRLLRIGEWPIEADDLARFAEFDIGVYAETEAVALELGRHLHRALSGRPPTDSFNDEPSERFRETLISVGWAHTAK